VSRSAASSEPRLSPAADVERLFCELVAIPSPSGQERILAEAIRAWLATHGVDAELDAAGERNDSDAGNLIATIEGAPAAPVLLFVAHMDTVETGAEAIAPVRGDDGIIRSAGETILGADNKAAVAAVMRLCARVAALPTDRRPTILAAFTCREESGRMGISLLRASRPVDHAFCVDGSRPIGTVITRALGQATFTYEIAGRRAHAAAAPQDGIDAARVAAEFVAGLSLGRRPGGGSASVAAILAGAALGRPGTEAALLASPTNSIADRALVRGEVRGFTVEEITGGIAEIEAVLADACQRHGARWSRLGDPERMVPPFPGAADSGALALVAAAAPGLPGVQFSREEAHASLEANYLAAWTDVVAVASGGRDPHAVTESIGADELWALEALLGAIVEHAAAAPGPGRGPG
jgi:tripeptide aminopeptidase